MSTAVLHKITRDTCKALWAQSLADVLLLYYFIICLD